MELVHVSIKANAHQCHKCSIVFASTLNLNRHLINCQGFIEEKEVQTRCDICQKTFSTKNGLVEHIKYIHVKENNFVCDYCTKAFTRRHDLTRHVSVFHEKTIEFVHGISPEVNYAVESNDTDEGQGVTNHVVHNDSSIKSKQGADTDLRELYMQTFPTCDNDMIDPTNIENS